MYEFFKEFFSFDVYINKKSFVVSFIIWFSMRDEGLRFYWFIGFTFDMAFAWKMKKKCSTLQTSKRLFKSICQPISIVKFEIKSNTFFLHCKYLIHKMILIMQVRKCRITSWHFVQYGFSELWNERDKTANLQLKSLSSYPWE